MKRYSISLKRNTNENYMEMLFLTYQIGKNFRQYKMLLLASHSKTQLLEEMDACRAEAEKVNKKDHSVPENEDMSRSDENVSEG